MLVDKNLMKLRRKIKVDYYWNRFVESQCRDRKKKREVVSRYLDSLCCSDCGISLVIGVKDNLHPTMCKDCVWDFRGEMPY